MVLQKRLDYGFNGYQVPAIPRGSRSARGRRGSVRKKVEERQMCAFELLATVAGELLQEKESSSDSSNTSAIRSQRSIIKGTIKQEQQHDEKVLKVEPNEQGSTDEAVLVSDLGLQAYTSKEFSFAQNDVGVGLSSDIDNADQSEKVGSANTNNNGELGNFLKVESDSPGYGESCEVMEVDMIGRQLESRSHKIGNLINGTARGRCGPEDLIMEVDNKPPALVTSDSSIEVPKCKDNHIPSGCFPGFRDDEKVVSRDDDENSSGCTQPSTRNMKAYRPSPRLGDRRIRKLLASKYWKVAPKLKDGGERSRTDMKLIFHNRRNCYTRQRSQRNSPFKRRKFFGRSSVLTSDGGISNVGISKSSEKGVDGETAGAGSRASSSVSGQRSSFQSRDSHVKLCIKSFRVPELFIEIPETATVGSLKRTVMEAVNAILGGGLRVGVVLKGNKVRDDNKTLVQTGISNNEKLDNLGFTLEPNPAHTPPPMHVKDPSFPVPCDTPQPINRYPTTPALDSGMSDATLSPPMTNLGNFVESDHDSVPSSIETSADNTTQDSRALVAIPTMSVDPLAAVPLDRKPRRSELVQRRIRRPFSVSEVEALVHAVEKLGTGRWRDVKLRAFDNAKHRTYVDLKDKWKTLVHTARISPQQRRGEPVPQELLDRVLAAHAYWSQQQAKQQVKQQNETCLLL